VSVKTYARAAPEKVAITEEYSVTQEISSNPGWGAGPSTGRIEIVVPYDGEEYFTRQAVDDVEKGNRGRNEPGPARIGYLLCADYARTDDLSSEMVPHATAAVIPIEVPVPAGPDSTDQLTSDRRSCQIRYDYRPDPPQIRPLQLGVELRDPDTMTLDAVDYLARRDDIPLPRAIAWLRQNAGFASGLELNITAELDLPLKRTGAVPSPRVALISVDWPAITSLNSTQLDRGRTRAERDRDNSEDAKSHPVRYNPVLGRLEWEDIPMEMDGPNDSGGDVRLESFASVEMRLKVDHPGELFATSAGLQDQMLKIHAEVEIPGYLLSGLEARLFDATGHWQRQPRPGARRNWQQYPEERYPWEPELTTRVSIDTECRILDLFAERRFKPYQQFVFDDVIPDDMRITDIVTVLRNANFEVVKRSDSSDEADPKAPRWLLHASRRQGPDVLTLLIAVEGEKFAMDRTQIMGDNRIKLSGSKESGRIRLSVLGTVQREHAHLAREMSTLQHALRDRFRFQQTSRR
jgi:hypothetical protein